MYPVSNAFLEAVKENTRKYYWTGRITTTDGYVYDKESTRQKIVELEKTVMEIGGKVDEYDDALVRQLIEKITVYDDHLDFEFKSGPGVHR